MSSIGRDGLDKRNGTLKLKFGLVFLFAVQIAQAANAKTPIQTTTVAAVNESPELKAEAPVPTATPEPAPPAKPFVFKQPNFSLQPFVQLQAWGVYSINRHAQLNTDPALEPVEQRLNLFFRRARLGFRGSPYSNLNYTLSFFYDNIGHDSLAATRNQTNPATKNGQSTDVTAAGTVVGVWDAFLTWKLSAESDLYHVTAGYFRPQISRESLTAAFNVNSFEKAISQNYVRQAVIGRGFGRAVGVNLGGLYKGQGWGTRYNVGLFNRMTTGDKISNTATAGETQGASSSPVLVARSEFYFGDPEMDKYGLSLPHNYFGKRRGVTLAVNASHQERTPTYAGSRTLGVDALFNWGHWTFDTEAFLISYQALTASNFGTAKTGHARIGYAIPLPNQTFLEPSLMASGYFGQDNSEFTGRDVQFDAGVNWYLDENRYKFYLHYVHQEASGSNLGYRADRGYDYGDYAGLGLTLQF